MIISNLHLARIKKRGLTHIQPSTFFPDKKDEDPEIFEFLLAEPYSTITGYFLENGFKEIFPVDSESRLFLPRIPLSERSGPDELKKIINENGIVIPSKGTILTGVGKSSEQPLIFLSIACFSLFVKFFHMILSKRKEGNLRPADFEYIDRIRMHEYRYTSGPGNRMIENNLDIPELITSAGRLIVSERLVDSIFGNISIRKDNNVYISKAGSFLDDLDQQIVKVPLNGIIEGNMKPSSEVDVHRNIYKVSSYNYIIHGHPLFTVILSLDDSGTGNSLRTPSGENIPVIEGEDETGNSVLPSSVPAVINRNRNVIVKGHGIFTAGKKDFNDPLQNIKDIENYCREEYFRRLN